MREEEMAIHSLPEGEWAAIKENRFISCDADQYAAYGIGMVNFPVRAIQALEEAETG